MRRHANRMLRATRMCSPAVALIALCAGACGGDDGGANADEVAIQACQDRVMAAFPRFEECHGATEADLDELLAACEREDLTMDPRRRWTAAFTAAVDDCAQTLTCEQWSEDLDDICFPEALESNAGSLVAADVLAACFAREATEESCAQEVDERRGDLAAGSAVERCLDRWAACADESSEAAPYWTAQHCGSIIALVDAARDAAGSCLELSCAQAPQCLIDAGAFGY